MRDDRSDGYGFVERGVGKWGGAMKLLIQFGDVEVKHWPVLFAGLAPKLRCWLQDETTNARVELADVQKLETISGTPLRDGVTIHGRMEKNRNIGWPLDVVVFFAGGRITFTDGYWKVLGEDYLEGDLAPSQTSASRLLQGSYGLAAGIPTELNEAINLNP